VLANNVPAQIIVVLRGAASGDKKLIQKIFSLKREPAVVLKAPQVYEATFNNEASLDLEALNAAEIGSHPGLTDLVCVNPVLAAAKPLTWRLEISVQGKNNPQVAQAYGRAVTKPYETRGVATATVSFPTPVNPNVGDDPTTTVVFACTATMMVRPDVSEAELKNGFLSCGFTVK
jgi:hypothetical protein